MWSGQFGQNLLARRFLRTRRYGHQFREIRTQH